MNSTTPYLDLLTQTLRRYGNTDVDLVLNRLDPIDEDDQPQYHIHIRNAAKNSPIVEGLPASTYEGAAATCLANCMAKCIDRHLG